MLHKMSHQSQIYATQSRQMAIRFEPSVCCCMSERKVDFVVVLGLFKPCFN
jgi:hypothetical protein